MATVPGQLIWEIVKKNNSFYVKQFGNGTPKTVFSKEPNNLLNLHSYKHSGLANKKTVTIQPASKEQGVLLATTKTKKQSKPASSLNKSVLKKEFSRMAKAVKNQVADNHYRPDLKKAALARLSAVSRSLRVSKSGVQNLDSLEKSFIMSAKEVMDSNNGRLIKNPSATKQGRFNRCFSFPAISIDPAVKSLKHVDSRKLKCQIRRWAKAVVTYARQLSDRQKSSRNFPLLFVDVNEFYLCIQTRQHIFKPETPKTIALSSASSFKKEEQNR
ncbi:hypothetical protein Leryth_020140 [Lithospermum erythrorhizon]|nr:hypothetical protein Leryth_020140 [Lithospermum erythrorhizon]